MKRYLAFLRGVNISGRNKLPMAELRKGFEEIGFKEVQTYLNSGNVIFSSDREDSGSLTSQIETMITSRFDLHIPVFMIVREDLDDILRHAPDWWGNGNKDVYDNLIFMMRPATFHEVFSEIGPPKDGLEQIEAYKEAVFWSFSRKDYQKTNWWSKTASVSIRDKLTVRTANTVRKMAGMVSFTDPDLPEKGCS